MARSLHSPSAFIGLVAIVLASAVSRSDSAQADVTPKLGSRIEGFQLRDFRGHPHTLDDYSADQIVVVAFLGTECPLAKLYARRLGELQQRYRDRAVAVLGISSNRQDSITELAHFAQTHEIRFPLLKDRGNRVADAFGAQRTPQVFVLDQERRVRYVGVVDNQYGIGVQRESPSQNYVADAIESLLDRKDVARPQTTAVGCLIGRSPVRPPSGDITYCKDIAPILNRRCLECHREGEIGPFPLATYEDVLGWEEMMLEVIDENRMPPWFADPAHGEFKNDARLTDEEKRLFRQWVANGSPQGEESDLPPPPTYIPGWRIAQPDQVVAMRDEPFAVPAEGVVDYQYFVVDPRWDTDKYIVAAEARPGNSAVVHHIIAYLIPPGVEPRKDRLRSMLVGYAPGSPPNVLRDGKAIHVSAGSKLLFELHYTPNGTAHHDLSRVGFCFTEPNQVTQLVRGRAAINHKFVIPPHADNHEVLAEYEAKQDELLLRMNPHMHVRGKAYRYEAVFPDQRRQILLSIPRYDFNWQLSYELKTPLLLPAGTRIICRAHYDNSAQNLANPDPEAEVRWGNQSWEEMMIGFFDVIEVDGVTKAEEVTEAEAVIEVDESRQHDVANDTETASLTR